MKKVSILVLVFAMLFSMAAFAEKNEDKGFNETGYNYNAGLFIPNYWDWAMDKFDLPDHNGLTLEEYILQNDGLTNNQLTQVKIYWDYRNARLMMKWNDAWLDENKVRHEGYDSYIGSGAWLTNHIWDIDENGKQYVYFVKIVAAPEDAVKENNRWISADGKDLGEVIWGSFIIIQEKSTGADKFNIRTMPGLGNW